MAGDAAVAALGVAFDGYNYGGEGGVDLGGGWGGGIGVAEVGGDGGVFVGAGGAEFVEGVVGDVGEGEAAVVDGLLEEFDLVGGEVGGVEPVGGFLFEFDGVADEFAAPRGVVFVKARRR